MRGHATARAQFQPFHGITAREGEGVSAAKYKNVSCRCLQGHTHRSRFEAGHCNALRERQRRREFYAYVVERKWPLVVNAVHICDHYPDFTLLDKAGNVLAVEEAKGFATAEWRIKAKLFEACYPQVPYRVIKRSANVFNS
jgi:hypothetical protein